MGKKELGKKMMKVLKNKLGAISGLLAIILVLSISSASLYIFSIREKIDKIQYISLTQSQYEQLIPLENGTKITQSFKPEASICRICLDVGSSKESLESSGGMIKGRLTVNVLDENKNVILSKTIEEDELAEDVRLGEILIETGDLVSNIGHEYTVEIISEIDNDELVYTSGSFKDAYTGGSLSINGEQQDSDLFIKLMAPGRDLAKKLYMFITLAVILSVCVVYILAIFVKAKPHILFLVAVLLFGAIFSFMFSPNDVPDEKAHYETSYRWSNVFLGVSDYSDGTDKMLMRAEDVSPTALMSHANDEVSPRPTLSSIAYTINNMFKTAEDKTIVETVGSRVGNIFQYFIPAIGISVGRLLNFGAIPTYYLARLMNLLAFALLGMFAVKKMPFGKNVFIFSALLPMTLQEVSSVSYDSIIIGLSFFFIAYCMYLAYTENLVRWREIIALAVSGGLLASAKGGIYIFIFGLGVLILCNTKISLKKRWLIVLSVGILMVAVAIVFNYIEISGSIDGEKNGFRNYSIMYALQNPKWFIKMVGKTFILQREFYVVNLIGSGLAWLNVYPNKTVTYLFPMVMLLASMKSDEEENVKIKKIQYPLNALICLAIIGVVYLVAITWNAVGSEIIDGVQSRYFIPILPLAILLLRNNIITTKRNVHDIVTVALCTINGLFLYDIFLEII